MQTDKQTPQERLKYHVTGAIERGEAQAITEQVTDSRTLAGKPKASFSEYGKSRSPFKHSYDIETVIDSEIAFITVDANNRTAAAHFAKRNGYPVRSVNMIG